MNKYFVSFNYSTLSYKGFDSIQVDTDIPENVANIKLLILHFKQQAELYLDKILKIPKADSQAFVAILFYKKIPKK